MAVKQIQLRGISRTPSDRMTRDGGLAESLNMQLDGEELAPMRLPDDVTSELLANYPAYAAGDKVVYIHHGNGYTNYIIEVQGSVYALFEGGATAQTLMNNDSVERATTMGNALIIRYASGAVNNFIYKDGRYLYLDLAALDLGAEFVVINHPNGDVVDGYTPSDPGGSHLEEIWNLNATSWNTILSTPEASMTETQKEMLALIREYQEQMWANFDKLKETNREMGAFCNPVLARYAVRLFDGSYGFVSAPVLLGAKTAKTVWMEAYILNNAHNFWTNVDSPYEAALLFGNGIPANWKDFIVSVDIFLSEDIIYPSSNANIVSVETYGGGLRFIFEGEQASKADASAKAAFLAATNFYRIASLSVEEVEALGALSGYNLLTERMNGRQDYRVTQPRFVDNTRYGLVPDGLMNYNGRLLALGDTYELKPNYGRMFGPAGAVSGVPSQASWKLSYKIRFYINKNGNEYTIDVKNGSSAVIGSSSSTHGWGAIFFPDVSCYKAELIENSSGNTLYTVKMQEHPSINCAYGYLGLGANLIDLTPVTQSAFSGEAGSVVAEHNKLSMTRTDNPFVYEMGNTQTFDDDIIDAATIAKALITNPYGLADIYVFTKGGIYSIGLMRDGSFNNIHPYTRDVLIPGTLAMIDHAVVFTTEKGVMLLSESGLQDISQVMRGKHDPLPVAAATLLDGDTDYRSLVPAATATEPFMAFMKGARAAYDYAGKRLLFFNDAYLYQYVFMLETATWHKTDMAPGVGYAILNSHPQCLVNCEPAGGEELRITTLVEYDLEDYSFCGEIAGIIAGYVGIDIGKTTADIKEDLVHAVQGGTFPYVLDISDSDASHIAQMDAELSDFAGTAFQYTIPTTASAVMDFTTLLDDGDYIAETGHEVKGLVVTRPLAFDAPDIRKVLKDLRIRTQANRTDVKYILLASMDGKTWKRLTSRGGGSFKWFKIVLVTSLSPIERIGWLDVDVQTRYMDKLR